MSKSKIAVTLFSLVTTVSSVYFYFNQKNNRPSPAQSESTIRAKLTSFELYKYKKDQLIARATGNNATLFSKGLLVCDGRNRLVQIVGGQRSEIESDRAEVAFKSENIFEEGAGLVDTILFAGNVDYTKGNNRFQTDWIKYTEKTGDAITDRPVRLESDGQFVAAEGGMTYNLKTEALKMVGGVFGSVKTDAVASGIGREQKK